MFSEIIKEKLIQNGHRAIVTGLKGNDYDIEMEKIDNESFIIKSSALRGHNYDLKVFDKIEVLLNNMPNHKAKKGNGRKYKVGDLKLRNTVVETIGKEYFAKVNGKSTYDPVHVLAAVLDWAELAYNGRGYIELR